MGIARWYRGQEFCCLHQKMKSTGQIRDQRQGEVLLKGALIIALLTLLLLAYTLTDRAF